MIHALVQMATQSLQDPCRSPFLFGHNHRRYLSEIGKHISVRAIRRETLRLLSWDCHHPSQVVRLLSRHTTDLQLRTYLGGGLYCGDDAISTTTMTGQLANAFGVANVDFTTLS
jgi:hypothetical protein